MSAISAVAVLTTGIAIGAAGHAALTTPPQVSHVAAAPAAQPAPTLMPQAAEVAQPRACSAAEGIVTDCTYE